MEKWVRNSIRVRETIKGAGFIAGKVLLDIGPFRIQNCFMKKILLRSVKFSQWWPILLTVDLSRPQKKMLKKLNKGHFKAKEMGL